MDAVFLLRAQLLHAAVIYGTCTLLLTGDRDVDEWLGWLEWVSGALAKIAGQTDGARDPDAVPGWLSQALRTLDTVDETDDPELFDETIFRGWASDEFERIAERARPIEKYNGEPLGEIKSQPSRAGMRLLGLMQDSLVLVSAPDESSRTSAAGAPEVLRHLIAARDEGVWELLTG